VSNPVYLVDDDEAVRKALALLLGTVGLDVTTFETPETFLLQVSSLEPGCLILDIRMPAITGLKLQEKLNAIGLDWPTIIISGHGDIEACRRAFHNGAIDFLSKPIDEQDIIDAIQKGSALLDEQTQREKETAELAELLNRLSQRESEVLEMVSRGITSPQIAEILMISPRTVESHRASIGQKLGTTSPAEQARFWQEGHPTP
jgi:FixJ family two-component response regulator